jgi:valine--pyruvate aminotransferase
VSRPTNPTGNVITNEELTKLVNLTRDSGTPLIVDNAYGLPFPNIVFTDAAPLFEEHMILCMSLSKLGLPGLRSGIIVAAPNVIQTITSVNAISMLANSSLGASLVTELINSDEIINISETQIKPFYERKAGQARRWCREYFDGVKYAIHKTEGAIFLWVWFPGLPITDIELYERIKQRDVLVLAGSHFFPGLNEQWEHTRQCLRISYAQDSETVRRGIEIIGQEVRRAFDQ